MQRDSQSRAAPLGATPRWKPVVAAVGAGTALIAVVVLSLDANRVGGSSATAQRPGSGAVTSSAVPVVSHPSSPAASATKGARPRDPSHPIVAGRGVPPPIRPPATTSTSASREGAGRVPATQAPATSRATPQSTAGQSTAAQSTTQPTTSQPASTSTTPLPTAKVVAASTPTPNRHARSAAAPTTSSARRVHTFRAGTLSATSPRATETFVVAGGVVGLQAAWSGSQRLRVTLFCGGISAGVRASSGGGESVTLVAPQGSCALAVALPTGDSGPVSYDLVLSFAAATAG